RIAHDVALTGRFAGRWYEKSGLSRFPVHGMGGIGKEENRETVQEKPTVGDAGIAAHIDDDLARPELPLGTWQFTGSNGTVIDQVMIGRGSFHDFAFEGEGSGRSKYHTTAVKAHSGGPGDIEEAPGLGGQAECAVSGA